MSDEELHLGAPRRVRRGWLPVAAVAAIAVSAGGYAAVHHSDRHPAALVSSATAPSKAATQPVAVDTEDMIVLPSDAPDNVMPASGALTPFSTTTRRNPDGSLTWTLLLRNNSDGEVRLSDPVHVHVAAALHARILRVELLDRGYAVTPGTYIPEREWLKLRVQLRVDCAQVDPASTPFPAIPLAVVMSFIDFPGSAGFVVAPPVDDMPSWTGTCD